jgi:hypothetical protein
LVFESGNAGSLRMSSLQGEYAYGLCFEEEYIDIAQVFNSPYKKLFQKNKLLNLKNICHSGDQREKKKCNTITILYLFRNIRLT